MLRDEAGRVLLAQRVAPKSYAGQWEFPGGKIEAGESVRAALDRELFEELGIIVRAARPLIELCHDYPEFRVRLSVWSVEAWSGRCEAREGQPLQWFAPAALAELPLLAADGPIVSAIRLPSTYVFTPPNLSERALLAGLAVLPAGALLRLRQPALNEAEYEACARALLPRCREYGLHLMLDRDPAMAQRLGAAGWHATTACLPAMDARPLPSPYWFAASAHNAAELAQARRCDADCAVLGPVQPTATHPGAATLGWQGFAPLVREAGLPVYAIGGLAPEALETAWRHGAQGLAGISAYWTSRRSV